MDAFTARFDDKTAAAALVVLLRELKLTVKEFDHLADNVFIAHNADAAMDSFISHWRKGRQHAIRFIMNHLPPRSPDLEQAA